MGGGVEGDETRFPGVELLNPAVDRMEGWRLASSYEGGSIRKASCCCWQERSLRSRWESRTKCKTSLNLSLSCNFSDYAVLHTSNWCIFRNVWKFFCSFLRSSFYHLTCSILLTYSAGILDKKVKKKDGLNVDLKLKVISGWRLDGCATNINHL